MEYRPEKREIILKRELSKLDKFVLDFVKILEKHTEYIIISGYVSILLGRSRATEDVDAFIKKMSKEEFFRLYHDLKKNGFYCINGDNMNELFSYLNDGMALRFVKEGKSIIPNFEVKFPKKEGDEDSFKDSITVMLPKNKLNISSLERHIAFKEDYLASYKDCEDAKHIEEVFGDKIDYEKVNKFKELVKRIKKNEEREQKS